MCTDLNDVIVYSTLNYATIYQQKQFGFIIVSSQKTNTLFNILLFPDKADK